MCVLAGAFSAGERENQMGAVNFMNRASAKTAQQAFDALVKQAKHDRGHGGYTGSIAEKHDFEMEIPAPGETPEACVKRCSWDDNHWSYDDKWGPAACVDMGADPNIPGNRVFVFFGAASS
jgi:hypothetical protein